MLPQDAAAGCCRRMLPQDAAAGCCRRMLPQDLIHFGATAPLSTFLATTEE
jgi:hypothetical protein